MQEGREDLALDTRRALFDLVTEFPGLHFREIVRRSDMSSSNVEYHLRHLVKHGILVVVEDGRLKRFYVQGKVGHAEKKILSVLRKEIPRGIVLFLLLEPGSGVGDIGEVFDLSPSQLSYYLRKLVDKGIISKEEGKSRYHVEGEDKVASILIAYRPTFMDALVDSFADAWLGRTQAKGRKKRKVAGKKGKE
ncbi:MAG: winged helix-turn-helix transcriptional regulator, partial [Thermoplasmata archaeon]|nr:winged helix-turn-helix transcriptional regulator [Thermoplasmata archaeon]